MSRFATSFAAGLLSGGMNEWIRQKGEKRQDARDAREQENHDYQKEQRQRERENNAAVAAAMNEHTGLLRTGEVVEMPKMSSEMGPPPEAAPDGAGIALQMPTTRKATIADRLGSEMKIAQASRDMTSFARLGREQQQAVDADGDLTFARSVMENPTGDEAKKLMRTIYKKTDAFSMRQDPKTGLATVDVFSPSGDFERSVQLSPAQLGQLAVVQRKLERGDPGALGELAAIDKDMAAAAAAEWQTKLAMVKTNNEVVKSGANMAINQVSIGLAQNADKRATEKAALEREERARELAEKGAKTNAAVELFRQQNPTATPEQIEAVRAGVIPAVPTTDGNAPAEVKLASAYVRAGLAKDMAGGLKMATQSKDYSPEKVRADIFGKALTANFGDAKKAQEAADAAMLYLFPVQPAGGGAGAAQVNTIASDPRAVAIRDDKKLTLEQKKAKLRELGYQ